MYQDILQQIEGIGIFPVVSLLMFVSCFSVMLVRVIRMDRTRARALASLALDDERPNLEQSHG